MLKYGDWLLEFHNAESKNITERIEAAMTAEFGNIKVVSNFEIFVREGEPAQTRTLFCTKSLFTMGANFIENGELYSIDFWDPTAKGPTLTMYRNSTGIEETIKLAIFVLKDPKPLNKPQLNAVLSESNQENIKITFKTPLPTTPVKQDESLYKYSDPETIFEDLVKWTDLVAQRKQASLIVTGSPGVGKTYLVTKRLKDDKVDYVHVKGRSTAAGLYISLYENRDRIIVIDDCDSVFKNEDAVNILKGALDSKDREVSWQVGKPLISPNSGQRVPTKFEFKGGVIFISNLPQKKIDDAVKTRSFVLEVALKPEQMIEHMTKKLREIEPQVDMPTKRLALKMISEAAKVSEHLEVSMRTLLKSITIIENWDSLTEIKRLIIQQCSYE